ncbi:MAG: ATP-binding cassette domain-containing protein [Rhodospirillales bacterium]|nr:ATP-binding cassette domain-containing protein [Rhodospirillales bacterium]
MTPLVLSKRLIIDYIRPYFGYAAVAVLFMIIAAGMSAAFAKLVQPVLDDVLYGKKENMLVAVAGMMAGAFIVRGIATYIHTVMMSRIGEWIIGDLQKDLFSKFIDLDLAFHQKETSSGLLSRVMNDVQMVRMAITEAFTGFGKNLMTLLMLVGVMFLQDWKLTLAALTFLPLAMGFVVWVGRRLRKVSKRIQQEMGGLTARLSQILQGIRLVKAYGQEDFERGRAISDINKVRTLMVKAVRISNLSTPFNEVIIGLVVFGIILYGGTQVAQDSMTPGVLMSFIAAFTLAYEPMKKLAKLNSSFQMGLGAAERVFEMLDQPVPARISGDITELPGNAPAISFENVSFSYADSETPVVSDLCFRAEAGQVTAIVGASGAGKTTLFNLLLRFYEIQAGKIRLDDLDIGRIDPKVLRLHMALVSQDVTIFNETVAQNIGYGRTGATQPEIEAAAKMAAAHDFIENLPLGYETVLGESGNRLSGGQRQRIAIARAILRDAPVLLLDEATSALDNEAEKAIQDALARFQKGRTTLVIAHRLSTVQTANKIIVMKDGRVVEEGTHDSLLTQGGYYAQMLSMMSA